MPRLVAAFLTAGIARVGILVVVADAGAAGLGVPFGFGLACFVTDEIEAIVVDVHRVERWLGLAALLVLSAVLVGVWRWNRRVVKEPQDEEGIAGHSPRPWEPRAVPVEDEPALEDANELLECLFKKESAGAKV